MLWFLGDNERKVTKQEFHDHVIPRLRERGLSEEDIRFVRGAIDIAIDEEATRHEGVTSKDIDMLIKHLHENAPDYVSSENLARVEEELRREL